MKKGSKTKGCGSWRRDQEQKDGALAKDIINKTMGLLRKGSRIKRIRLFKIILRTKGWGS